MYICGISKGVCVHVCMCMWHIQRCGHVQCIYVVYSKVRVCMCVCILLTVIIKEKEAIWDGEHEKLWKEGLEKSQGGYMGRARENGKGKSDVIIF